MPKQEGVLAAAATSVPVAWSGGGGCGWRGRRAPGGLVVGGGRRGRRPGHPRAVRPRGREEEGAVVGVLVQVGVGPPALGWLDGRVLLRGVGGDLCQFVFEQLHLPGQSLHGVGVVGGDGVGERLRRKSNTVK